MGMDGTSKRRGLGMDCMGTGMNDCDRRRGMGMGSMGMGMNCLGTGMDSMGMGMDMNGSSRERGMGSIEGAGKYRTAEWSWLLLSFQTVEM